MTVSVATDVELLSIIIELRDLGVTIQEIREYFNLDKKD